MSPWRLFSLLFDYPDRRLFEHGEELRRAVARVEPASCREALSGFLEHLAAVGVFAARREYVDTFDFARRGTLYLSFHTYGDRRKRGMAMVHLKRIYREAGFELNEGILPDHLPVILEFTEVAPERGIEVLADFRPALEVVRAALHEGQSPYAPLMDALVDLLPEADAADIEKARRIAAEGPPEELVGLEPFGLEASPG